MTNIDMKYKLHQVLSLTPPTQWPRASSCVFISLCCRFLTFSAHLNRSVPSVQYFGLRQRNGSLIPRSLGGSGCK